MKKCVFRGCATALATPFDAGGRVDLSALSRLLDYQLEGGVRALVVCATTGECATLSDGEIEEIIRFTVKKADKRLPVIAGTGRNSTERTLALSRLAEECGADALLCVTPYYNKTTEKGLLEHFFYVADRVDIPIIIYNVPQRTGMSVSPEAYAALSKHPNIYGAKEASGDLSLIARGIAKSEPDFSFYSGNDDQAVPIYALGGKGVISTISNVVPERVQRMCALFEAGETAASAREQLALLPLCDAAFAEVNPIPIKAALETLGLCGGYLRPPLCEASERTKNMLKKALEFLKE